MATTAWGLSMALSQHSRCPPADHLTEYRTHVPDTMGCEPNSRGFAALLAGFKSSGGLWCGDDLARLLEYRQCGDLGSLARLMVSGDIFSFQWQGNVWVPMFQFDPSQLSVKQGARQVHGELAPVFDGWMLAAWFAQPNTWLKGRRPVDLLDLNFPAVCAAARADRFVATG